MLVSDSHKFIVFHIPKTGGSSLTYELAKYLNPCYKPPDPTKGFMHMGWQPIHHIDRIQHRPVQECRHTEFWEPSYFKAAFVRNPFDLVVSAWYDKDVPFEQFVIKEVASRKNIVSRWGSQYDYLSNHRNELMVDWIGKYEQMDKDWEKLCYMTKIEHNPLKRLNSSWKKPYHEYYNQKTYEIVSTLFKKDLKYFGYTLDKTPVS
tara:strand:+ start:2593 stop:3207 length:615 start_codon:yes stop_codon:yes gene_type:complete